MTLTLRVSDEDSQLIRDFAKLHGVSVSEYIRSTVMEHIEDEIDLEAYRQAKAEFEANPVRYSHEEVGRMLGLK